MIAEYFRNHQVIHFLYFQQLIFLFFIEVLELVLNLQMLMQHHYHLITSVQFMLFLLLLKHFYQLGLLLFLHHCQAFDKNMRANYHLHLFRMDPLYYFLFPFPQSHHLFLRQRLLFKKKQTYHLLLNLLYYLQFHQNYYQLHFHNHFINFTFIYFLFSINSLIQHFIIIVKLRGQKYYFLGDFLDKFLMIIIKHKLIII